jgi:hypothetical protein
VGRSPSQRLAGRPLRIGLLRPIHSVQDGSQVILSGFDVLAWMNENPDCRVIPSIVCGGKHSWLNANAEAQRFLAHAI